MFKISTLALSLCSALLLNLASYIQLSAQSPVACPGFKTWTQGGYGANSNGQPVQFLNANFGTAFPAGLEIGCTNKIRLTSAQAVRNFIPQGTAPSYLPAGTLTNPTKNNFNSVLAGQLVTLTLNVKFDQTFASFGSSSTNLKDLVITTGPFLGWTVQQLLDDANKKIGGCTTVSNASYSAYNDAADKINRAYDNGVSNGNYLACPMTVSCSSTNAVCFDSYTGSMTVKVAGGVPPYSIVSWSNGASGSFNGTLSATASNLHAGTYTAVVSDVSGKQLSTTCTVSEPPQLVATSTQTNVSCYGGSNGSVTVTATGGTAPYSGTGTFSGLSAGTYSYTVTDSKGCTSTVSVIITQPELLVAANSQINVTCYGLANGSVTVTASGGTGPYSGTGTFSNLASGIYSYTVTDANGCTANTSVTITEPALLVASATQTNVSCYGGSNGSVTVTATGGTSPYSGTGTFSGLSAGTYSYTVTDANGCTSDVTVEITQPTKLAISGGLSASTGCNPDPCDGYVFVDVTGGSSPYAYAWTVGGSVSGETSSQLENLCGGVFASVVVSDANGCEITYAFPALPCTPNTCDPLRTYTMGGWGAPTPACTQIVNTFVPKSAKYSIGTDLGDESLVPSGSETIGGGNSPAVQYLHGNFNQAFPYGLTIGCTNKVIFNSACAITNFLPSGGPSVALGNGTVINPANLNNTLAGQICAVTLAVVFDAYDAGFAGPEGTLGARIIQTGTFSGMTVAQLLQEANNAIGGCGSSYSLPTLNEALTAINENYDNGDGTDNGFLGCTAPAGRVATTFTGDLFPNPAQDASSVKVEASEGETVNIIVADFMGRTLYESTSKTVKGMNEINLPLSGISARQCIVRVTKGTQTFSKILHITK